MKVVIDNSVFPPRTHYTEVDTKFTSFTPKCRVLPANYYADYNTFFTLKARYEPGENKYFPKGGFEIYHSEGGLYNYELDEVVVHPFELGMRKYFSKSENASKEKVTDPNKPKGKRGRPKSDVPYVRPVYVPTGGKRGRRPLDPEVKAEREAQLAAKQALPRGKRGRPKKQIA